MVPSYPPNCPSEVSFLHLTGPVSVNTPKVVLVELADSMRLEYPTLDNIMQRYIFCGIVNGSPPLNLPTPPTREGWVNIGRFVNSEVEDWDLSRLQLAFKFILTFLGTAGSTDSCPSPICNINLGNYPTGKPRSESPESLSGCILYRILKLHHIDLTYETTLEEMFQIATLIHRPLPQLRELTIGVVQQLPYPTILDGYIRLNQLAHISTGSVPTEPYPIVPRGDVGEVRDVVEESSSSTSDPEVDMEEPEEPEGDQEEEDEEDDSSSDDTPTPPRVVADPEPETEPLLQTPQIVIEVPPITNPYSSINEMGQTGASGPISSNNSSPEKRRKIEQDSSGGYQSYIDIYKSFNDHRQVLRRLTPQSELEAVTLAVINYGIDISSSRYPLQEYAQLNNPNLLNRPGVPSPTPLRNHRGRRSLNPVPTPATEMLPPIGREIDGQEPESTYLPIDPELRSRYLEDPEGILLRNNFNPKFPPEYYSPPTLLSLCIQEGYLSSEVTGAEMHELLQLAYVSNNFYHGKMKETTNSQTLFYPEDLRDLASELVVCYGIREQTMTAFQYRELADWFQTSNSLINPADRRNEPFEPRAIRKLKQLCRKKRKNESEDTWNIRRQLLKIIEYIEANLSEKNERFIQLSSIYKEGNPDLQRQIGEAARSLMNIGFYCRGWEGTGPYPVEHAPEKVLADIEIRVTTELSRFRDLCERLGEVGELILNLPLLKFSTNEFLVNTNERVGLTIKDKLDIISRGPESEDPQYNCIAVSSSYIVSTAYRIFQLLKFDLPFDIAGLRSIHNIAS